MKILLIISLLIVSIFANNISKENKSNLLVNFSKLESNKKLEMISFMLNEKDFTSLDKVLLVTPFISSAINETSPISVCELFKDASDKEKNFLSIGLWFSHSINKKTFMLLYDKDANVFIKSMEDNNVYTYLDLKIRNKTDLNTLWSTYFSSGNIKYLDKLVEVVFDDNLFLSTSAKNLFKQNSSIPSVKNYINDINLDLDKI